jgi:hypothetical protein
MREMPHHFDPQLADVKHDHRREDGKPIVPIIEITGYPGPKEIAPLPVAANPQPPVHPSAPASVLGTTRS